MELLLRRSLLMLLFLALFYCQPVLEAKNLNESSATTTMAARSLDAVIQEYACRVFVKPKTGISYDRSVQSSLAGITYTAMMLPSDSLRRRGYENYNEFQIPTGVLVTPYVEMLVLVYQNLGGRSDKFYPLPGFTYIAPVLGLLPYSAANLTATNLPELNITASLDPISIVFSDVKGIPEESKAKCVRFDLQGLVYFSNVESGNTCSTMQQGHFSIVTKTKKKHKLEPLRILALTFIGIALCVLLCSLCYTTRHKLVYTKKQRRQQMERAEESVEAHNNRINFFRMLEAD